MAKNPPFGVNGMQANFKVLSLTHRKAPVEIRELMHLDASLSRQMGLRLREILGLEEVLVLSTCNRTEIYYSSETDLSGEILRVLCIEKGLPNPQKFEPYFEYITEDTVAVQHLFEVAMGLQSQVVGDLQISNQVKQAYAAAADDKLAGPFLHRLLHTIFHCNKRVQQETPYRDGAASVSYAAAELARDFIAHLSNPSVLVLGLGEMGTDTARSLIGGDFGRMAVMNRTAEKAEALAAELDVECLPFESLAEVISEFTIVISAASCETPLIHKGLLVSDSEFSQQYFIDLSVPRSISRDVETVAGVIRYDIDEIRTRTDETLARREAAIPQVRAIIASELAGFSDWSKELTISPTIQKLKDALEQIRREEVARHLKNTDGEATELVEKVTKSMMNKIIKLPVLQLKAACKRGEQETLIDLLSDLFDLEHSSQGEKV